MVRPRKILRLPILAVACFLLSGCGGASDSADPAASLPADKPDLTQIDVIAKVYDDEYSLPDGFLVDERANTVDSYSLYHVKDTSISYELCTDEYLEAQAWEEADNDSRAVNGYLVGSYENERYFEFIRELSYPNDAGNVQSVTSPGFARIFKCAAINRDGVDRNLRDGFGGYLNMTPLNPEDVRNFAEYLWQFAFFENATRKVLSSTTSAGTDTIEHTLKLAFLVKQGFERCDRIEVFDWIFSANPTSGEVQREFRFAYAIEARDNSGTPEQCL